MENIHNSTQELLSNEEDSFYEDDEYDESSYGTMNYCTDPDESYDSSEDETPLPTSIRPFLIEQIPSFPPLTDDDFISIYANKPKQTQETRKHDDVFWGKDFIDCKELNPTLEDDNPSSKIASTPSSPLPEQGEDSPMIPQESLFEEKQEKKETESLPTSKWKTVTTSTPNTCFQSIMNEQKDLSILEKKLKSIQKKSKNVSRLCRYTTFCNCTSAHSLKEWDPIICKYDKKFCRKEQYCVFFHPSRESKSHFLSRNITLIKTSFYSKYANAYKQNYLL
jgi:hypothetical protein